MVSSIPGPVPSSGPGPSAAAGNTAGPSAANPSDQKSFKEILLNSLDEVNRLQTEADHGVQALVRGETDNLAEVFTAVNKAGIAFDLLMEIRNKLMEAYQEINQIRV